MGAAVAKLPPIDVHAHWIRDLLHRGRREEALDRLHKVLASGKAGAETRALAEYLATAKRGRQPFGARHLWYEIGIDNDDLRAKGMPYAERLAELAARYMIADRQLKAAIARYEAAMDEIRAIDPEI